MQVTWEILKEFSTSKSLSIQYIDLGDAYDLKVFDNVFSLSCTLVKNGSIEVVDFESNFKSAGNRAYIQNIVVTDGEGTKANQLDIDGAQIVRTKAAKKGWSFWALPIEATTASLDLPFCQDRNGVAYPWVTAKIYDNFNVEITVPGVLNANLNLATKTVIDIEPPFDYEIIGGSLRINNNPSQDVRLWIVIAPDIPANLGGSKEFASGINLKFLSADSPLEVDGRVSKFVTYNSVDHRGKIRMIFKHPPGLQVNLMFLMEMYRQ